MWPKITNSLSHALAVSCHIPSCYWVICLERKGAEAKESHLLGKFAGTMTKSSVSQEEFLLLPSPPAESFSKKPGESWVGEVSALARICWISPRDCCEIQWGIVTTVVKKYILFNIILHYILRLHFTSIEREIKEGSISAPNVKNFGELRS